MHQGVKDFIRWLEDHRDHEGVNLNSPATSAELAVMEQQVGAPLPADLRFVLTRFNGGTIPAGTMLPAGIGPGTIDDAMRSFAGQVDADFLDPELPMPFHRTLEGSLLCFDRSAGPVADTWPIVDFYEDTGDMRLVYRTLDGWCRTCVLDWRAPDADEPFSLHKYLSQGLRHVEVEPDVSTAHATVAHALRRAGEPEQALESYLRAARCVPPLHWCDWEALKLAALLDRQREGLEAATRLAARAPAERWADRETTPAQVAYALARLARAATDRDPWIRLLDQLVEQAVGDEERSQAHAVRRALVHGGPLPAPCPPREVPAVAPQGDLALWWKEARRAYSEGALRDDDLLLDARLEPLAEAQDLTDLLRIRREF